MGIHMGIYGIIYVNSMVIYGNIWEYLGINMGISGIIYGKFYGSIW